MIPKALRVKENLLNKGLMEELSTKPYLSYGASDPAARLRSKYRTSASPIVRTFAHWPKILALYTRSASKNLTVIPVPDSILEATEFHLYYPKELSKLDWFRGLITECLITL